jgi:hypothetical protein
MAYVAIDKAFLELLVYHSRFGMFPETLGELESRLAARLPNDPFSGKSLVYKRLGKGFLIYSCGMNLVDENGEITNSGSGVRIRFDDIVWKLTDDPSRSWHPLMQPVNRVVVTPRPNPGPVSSGPPSPAPSP